MIAVEALEPPIFDPTDDEIAWERACWIDQDRIVEFEAWFIPQADEQEHDYSDECDCTDCHAAFDEFCAQDREWERAIREYERWHLPRYDPESAQRQFHPST